MQIINDRSITVSTGTGRKCTNWQPAVMPLGELYDRLHTPIRGEETLAAYMQMSKTERDNRKDIGGFVGGQLAGRRKKANVQGRDLVTLDLDNLPPGATAEVLRRCAGLGVGYCVYSTRKHCPEAPRLRIVVPTDHTMQPDEYEPISRRLAELIQPEMTWFDATTFQIERLMYWPSACADAEYVFRYEDKPFLSADGMLALYEDWRNVSSWATVPGEAKLRDRSAKKQGDPREKSGVVGAFCRTYDVPAAMEKFLPGVYRETDVPDRYTYAEGSTAGGAVLYDDGRFLYSHHATDPCSGVLVNAFDLVRLHKFGAQDDDAQEGTPVNRLPSFDAMCRLAVSDPEVSGKLQAERLAQVQADFAGIEQQTDTEQPPNNDWLNRLAVHPKTGKVLNTIDNIWLILENDPQLKGRFALNEFAGRGEILGVVPWDPRGKRRAWEDNDNQGLYWYLEKVYEITGAARVDGALSLHSNRHAFNEVVDYLQGVQWDGVPRLDTLLIDYLGAEDTAYTRAVTRKAFTAAVARALKPGCKFDCMTILAGPQGIGKSTLLNVMSRGYFNDSLRTFEGKEACEVIQGVWLVEVSELEAFNKAEVGRVKQFLSQKHDRFRAAYGRHVKELPRRCVFFGTTNESEFLSDRTGNRRFWPVDVGVHRAAKSIWNELNEETVSQIWAEAVMRYRLGEPLYLSGEVGQQAAEKQEGHRRTSVREGIIRDFLEQQVPEDWSTWKLDQRGMFWQGAVKHDGTLVPRERVCALEIWCEALGGDPRFIRNSDAAEINSIVAAVPGWKRMTRTAKFGYCKTQRGFERTVTISE